MLQSEDVEKYHVYPYHCLMRQPMPGAVPKDGLEYVQFKGGTTLGGHHFWGTAVYSRKLSREEIDHYDMEPTCFVVTD